ncbi:hypothetical protein [Pseudarthrobacter sp. S9]
MLCDLLEEGKVKALALSQVSMAELGQKPQSSENVAKEVLKVLAD